MKTPNKEKIKAEVRKELEAIKMVQEVFDELGGRDSVSGPISVAKDFYLYESVGRIIALCSHYTYDLKASKQIADKLARTERIRYNAFRRAGFTKKEALAFCTVYE